MRVHENVWSVWVLPVCWLKIRKSSFREIDGSYSLGFNIKEKGFGRVYIKKGIELTAGVWLEVSNCLHQKEFKEIVLADEGIFRIDSSKIFGISIFNFYKVFNLMK